MKYLHIIFTLFDPSALEYLRLFNIKSPEQAQQIGLGFRSCTINWTASIVPKNIDIIICSENHFTPRAEAKIQDIISLGEKSKIFLTLRQDAAIDTKRSLETSIYRIVGDKLQLPIKEERHTSGKAFDLLCKLGKFYLHNKIIYRDSLKKYRNEFKINLDLETKLLLINHFYQQSFSRKVLEKSITSPLLYAEVEAFLLNHPIIYKELNQFSNVPQARLEQLQKIIFPA